MRMCALHSPGSIGQGLAATQRLSATASADGSRSSRILRLPLKAAVSFYGGHIPPLLDRAPRLSGPMLFVWGGLDHHISTDQRRAVIAGVTDADKTFVDVVFSNADHGFFNDARASYQAHAAAQAWSLTLSFLDTYCPR